MVYDSMEGGEEMTTAEHKESLERLKVVAECMRKKHMQRLKKATTIDVYKDEFDNWEYWYQFGIKIQNTIDEMGEEQ